MIEGFIVKRAQRSPGKTKIAGMFRETSLNYLSNSVSVCGSSGFTDEVRDIVLKTMKEYREVEFVETEFRPQGKDDINNTGARSDRWKRLTSRLGGISVEPNTFHGNIKSGIADIEKGLRD